MKTRKIAVAAAALAIAGTVTAAFPGVGLAAESGAGAKVTAGVSSPDGLESGRVNWTSSAGHPCGATTADWSDYYHHCTNDGQSIQVLARFVLVGNTIACVGPGQTVKVAVTSVYSLDWNGRTCTAPGTQWPA